MYKIKKRKTKLSDRVAEFILTRETEELASLKRQNIADTLGLNSNRMSKAFAADQSITLEQFIVREKLHRALFILDKENEISIDDLARRMGFSETAGFAREFEDYLLIPPQRYKEIVHS